MSTIATYNLEEAIGWTGLRAMLEAVKNAPEIPVTENMHVSVEIRVMSDNWPGTTDSGRSKPTIVGSAACLWSGNPNMEAS